MIKILISAPLTLPSVFSVCLSQTNMYRRLLLQSRRDLFNLVPKLGRTDLLPTQGVAVAFFAFRQINTLLNSSVSQWSDKDCDGG